MVFEVYVHEDNEEWWIQIWVQQNMYTRIKAFHFISYKAVDDRSIELYYMGNSSTRVIKERGKM